MKFLKSVTLFSILFFGLAAVVAAAPFKPNFKNPNVVSYHEDGTHGIATKPGHPVHEGQDLVLEAGESKVFHQWFYGEGEPYGLHGEHSVWRPAKNGCPASWTLIEDPHGEWGDHFEEGLDYCVKTNIFRNPKNK